jgi:hypothetical protein
MNNFWTGVFINGLFIFGSILFLYSSWILWAKKSYEKSKKEKKQ